jgi:hypothetical protein
LVIDLTSWTVLSDGLAVLADLHRMRDRVEVTLARDSCLLRMLDAVGLSVRLATYPTVTAAMSLEGEQGRISLSRAPCRSVRLEGARMVCADRN